MNMISQTKCAQTLCVSHPYLGSDSKLPSRNSEESIIFST